MIAGLRNDRVLLDPAGQLAEIETVARDITADHHHRSDLQDRDAVINAFFECAAEGIVAVNRTGQIVLVNPRAESHVRVRARAARWPTA